MTGTGHSIIDAIRAIDQLRIEHCNMRAERDMLRRRIAELEAERNRLYWDVP